MRPSVFLAGAVALVAIAGCTSNEGNAATKTSRAVKPVARPAAGDWTQVVSPTPAGGFVMGNPNARVKLVEYGSLTCPHCKHFDDEGVPKLLSKYVKSGQVSWEFRHYVRDSFDLTASLIARCNGAKGFFPLMRALYKDQDAWMAQIQKTTQERIEQLTNLPPNRQFLELSKVAGLQGWAAAHGLPSAKSTQCLTNVGTVNQLVEMTGDATREHPDFQGTPTFIVNGAMLKDTATWDALEPQLRSALGERG